jgi:hypothetical protein
MKKITRKITQALIIGTLIFGTAAMSGCKKKKELAAAQAAEAIRLAEQIEEATAILNAIIADPDISHVDANYAKLDKVKAMNLQDPGVLNLIIKAQEKLASDKVAYAALLEKQKQEAEALRAQQAAQMKLDNDKKLLNQHFEALVGQEDVAKANTIIQNTLPMFAGGDVPVLIIIAQDADITDYDKPTTIKEYLNYLKDVKNYKAEVDSITYNANGKISELVLRKTNF